MMKETFRELLAKTNGELCQNSEFIELNKFRMVQLGHMNSKDYEIFWGCMKLYDQFGVNYFDEYLSLRCGVYGCFSHGISAWFQQEISSQRSPVDLFLSIVDIIRFFELPSYDGIPFSEYEYAYNHMAHQVAIEKRQCLWPTTRLFVHLCQTYLHISKDY